MNEAIRQLQKRVKDLQRSIGMVHTKQLNIVKVRDNVRSFVDDYFKEFRSTYLSARQVEEDLSKIDSSIQDLLRCTQRRSLVSVYKRILKEISPALHDLELKSVAPTTARSSGATDDIRHKKILQTLEKVSSTAASSYEQGLLDLLDPKRKSWRGTAVEFREALRELLDKMAPDEDVKAQPGFKLEPDTDGPTMKQKTIFILKSRRMSGTQVKASSDGIEVIEALVGKFVRSVYSRSSVGTHTLVTKDEVLKIREYVTLALTELMEIKA